jgi:hypothetical protein
MPARIFAAMLAATCASAALADEPPPAAAASPDRSVTVYPNSYFANQNASTAWDMISRLPGFTFDGGDSVRGFAGAAGNVLIDGERPTSKNDALTDILRRIQAGEVDRIEVIRGGAPGIDMHGKTVVANIIRKRGGGFHGTVVGVQLVQAGHDITQGRLVGSWKRGAVEAEGNVLLAQYIDNFAGYRGAHTILDGSGAVQNSSEMHNFAGGFQATGTGMFKTPLAGGVLRLNASVTDVTYRADLHDYFAGTFVFAGPQDEHDLQDETDGELDAHYEHPMGPKGSLELLAIQRLSRRNVSSFFQNDAEIDEFGLKTTGGESIARAILHRDPSANLSFEGGGEFAYNWVRTRTSFVQNGVGITVPAGNDVVSEDRGEAFATATWRPASKLTVEAGARLEASQIASRGDVVLSNRFVYPKPRIVLTWAASGADQLRLRVEREVGQLDFANFTASSILNSGGSTVLTGNPNLTPQQDWAVEFAGEHHFGKSGVLGLTARSLAISDVIDRAPDPTGQFDAPANIGSGRETDFLASFTLPLDRIIPGGELRGAGTWRVSRVTDPTTLRTRAISGQHRLDGELHFAQALPALKSSWGVDLVTPTDERYYRFNEIDDFRFLEPVVTLFVEYKPRKDLFLRFMLDNAADPTLDVRREVFAGPRSTFASPAFVDDQRRHAGRILYFRVRKLYG